MRSKTAVYTQSIECVMGLFRISTTRRVWKKNGFLLWEKDIDAINGIITVNDRDREKYFFYSFDYDDNNHLIMCFFHFEKKNINYTDR